MTSATIGLLEGLATTRAIRRYKTEPVSDQDLATMLWAATRAPTGSNRQNFRFVVITDGPRSPDARRVIAAAGRTLWDAKRAEDRYDSGSGADPTTPKGRMAATMEHYTQNLAQVPVIVLACLIRSRGPSPTEGASVYPACQNLLLAARALGLGGVLTQLHVFCEPQLRSILDIPDDVGIHATITIGHPQGHHGPVRRRPLRDLVFDDGWGAPAPWAVDQPSPAGTQK